MAAITASSPGDRQAYIKYSQVVYQERQLLDRKSSTENQIKLMQQTLTYLALNSSNPSTDPAIRCVSSTIATHKKQLESIVSQHIKCKHRTTIQCISGKGPVYTFTNKEGLDKKRRTVRTRPGQGIGLL